MNNRLFFSLLGVCVLVLCVVFLVLFSEFAVTGVSGKPQKTSLVELVSSFGTPSVDSSVSSPAVIPEPVLIPEPLPVISENVSIPPQNMVTVMVEEPKVAWNFVDPRSLKMGEAPLPKEGVTYAIVTVRWMWLSKYGENGEKEFREELIPSKVYFGTQEGGQDDIAFKDGQVYVQKYGTLVINAFFDAIEQLDDRGDYASRRPEMVMVLSWHYTGQDRVYTLEVGHDQVIPDFGVKPGRSDLEYAARIYNGWSIPWEKLSAN